MQPDVNMRLDNQPQPPDAVRYPGAGKESRRHSEP